MALGRIGRKEMRSPRTSISNLSPGLSCICLRKSLVSAIRPALSIEALNFMWPVYRVASGAARCATTGAEARQKWLPRVTDVAGMVVLRELGGVGCIVKVAADRRTPHRRGL